MNREAVNRKYEDFLAIADITRNYAATTRAYGNLLIRVGESLDGQGCLTDAQELEAIAARATHEAARVAFPSFREAGAGL